QGNGAVRAVPQMAGVRGAAVDDLYSGVFTTGTGAVLQAECETGSGEMTLAAPTGTTSGESVQLSEARSATSIDMTIVGTGVLPLDAGQFRSGSGMTFAGLSALPRAGGATAVAPEMLVFDVADSADLATLRNGLVERGLTDDDTLFLPGDARIREDVLTGLTLDDVSAVPRALALLAAVLGAAVLALLVVARRRDWDRELAIHRAIGFTGAQTRRAGG